MRWGSIAAAAYGLAATATALDPIEYYGGKLFNSDGSQFFIMGVAYQLSDDDPLVDVDQCKRDIALMSTLKVNTIRVYHVDPAQNHDGCMSAFSDAGIYLFIDMDTFSTYIVPTDLHWDKSQYVPYTEVMDAFHSYDNLLGLFVGNEVIAKETDSPAGPYVKAAVRDLKAYRDSKGYRKFGVGYSAADILQLRPMVQDYLTCGGNSSESVDFFGLNSYSWCGDSNYVQSTYNQIQEYAVDFPVPIFISETGCIIPEPRTWEDQDAIFSSPMVDDWSGAIVYEWIQESNGYGIVTYSGDPGPDGIVRSGTPTAKQPDFDNLKSRWDGIHPTGVSKSDYNTDSVKTPSCPSSTAGGWWQVDGNVALPTLGQSGAPPPLSTVSAAVESSTQTGTATITSGSSDKTGSSTSGATGTSGSSGNSDSSGSGNSDKGGIGAAGAKPVLALCSGMAGVVLMVTLWL